MTNPTNPERIEIGGGYNWQPTGVSRDTGRTYGFLCFPDGKAIGVMYLHEVQQMAAAMQPAQVSADAVECARNVLEEHWPKKQGWRVTQEMAKQSAKHIQQHTDARVTELTQRNAELVVKILEHASKMQSTWEFERLVQLLPEDNQAVQDAIAIRKWADQKEPVGAKVMCGDRGSSRQKEHNKAEFDRCEEGKVYLCYDHYRNAFWGPNRGGYCYRRTAGHYDKKGVGEVILGSNRYFTVEEVPANIISALASQGVNGGR